MYIQGNYDQGIRRIQRAFSDKVVQSSYIEECNSSEEIADVIKLDKNCELCFRIIIYPIQAIYSIILIIQTFI